MQETMILGLQVPREFLIGGMSWSGTSVTFRMVENFFLNHVRGLKKLLRFIVDRVSAATGLKKIDIGLTRLKWVDDVQQKSLLVQANQAGKLSDDSMMKELGHDMAQEFEKMLSEADKRKELSVSQAKVQAEAQGEAMLVQLKYQSKMAIEQAKMQRDIVAEYQAMGFSDQEIQQMLASVQNMNPAGGQFQPGEVLKKEPNKPGVNGNGAGMTTPITDPNMWAEQFSQTLGGMNPTDRDGVMMRLQLQNPQMHGLVADHMIKGQGGVGVDTRGNPDQKPPRRESSGGAPAKSNSKVKIKK